MGNMRTSKTKLFLLEMVIILLFFAFAGAVCMNLFVKAKLLSQQSTDLTQATLQAQAAAETIKSIGKDADELFAMIGAVPSQDGLCVYYDQEWNEVSVEQDATYEMKIVFLEENRELTSNITVEKEDDIIYSLTTTQFDGGFNK